MFAPRECLRQTRVGGDDGEVLVCRARARRRGGEPVDLWRTLSSHGVADLAPNALDEESRTLVTTLPLPRGRARTVRIGTSRPGFAWVEGRQDDLNLQTNSKGWRRQATSLFPPVSGRRLPL